MATRLLAAALALVPIGGASFASAMVQTQVLNRSESGARLQLDRVPVNIAIEAVIRRVSSLPFLICDAALNDKRLISVRLESYQLNLPTVRGVVGVYGYRVVDRGGVLYVCDDSSGKGVAGEAGSRPIGISGDRGVPVPSPASGTGGPVWGDGASGLRESQSGVADVSIPLGSPLSPGVFRPAERRSPGLVQVQSELLGYRPDYISPGALLAAVERLFPDVVFSVVSGEGQRPALFASGPVDDVARFRKMAIDLDRSPDGVDVQAIVLEVGSSERTGYGVSLILDALRSSVGVGVAIAGEVVPNQLSFKSGSFEGVLSAVGGTSGVRVLSSPRLRGRAGEKLRLQVGSDVPTLGAVVENPSGSTAQSIQYRSSGVIFEVVPTVFGRRIGLAVHQELSAFAATETGVRGSPTLTTRTMDSTVDLESGEWVILGGLTQSEDQNSRSSLLGLVPIGKTRIKRSTELVLLINVKRAQSQSSPLMVPVRGVTNVASRR